MPNLPLLKPREIEKILLQNNFLIKRQTGSHRVYHNTKNTATVVVPFHNQNIPKGTLRSIIRQSKLSFDKFLK